jgi:hypothetical protein
MRTAGALLVGAICAACALATAGPARAQVDGWFQPRPFPSSTFTLDDLGVVDYEGDGDLDVFTTNHLATQLLMANDGGGSFTDRLTAARLNQTPALPGWEDSPNVPSATAPGLYIYRQGAVVLQHVGTGSVSGELRFLAPVQVQAAAGAQATLSRDTTQQPPRNVVRFAMSGNSTLRLRADSTALPIDAVVDAPFPRAEVFVGRREVNPPASRFTLYLRDRHGMAWADYNGDGRLDVFIARGGVSGNIRPYKGVIQDELQIGEGSTFHDGIGGTGIRKGTCRGRAAAAVDYNRDGLLDVFSSCYRDSPILFRQQADGTFKSASRGLRKANVAGTAHVWLDLDERGGPELVSARRTSFTVHRRRKGKWVRAQSLRGRHNVSVQKLAVADFENDGDPDVFAASDNGSTLLVNRRGRLRKRKPKKIGLPPRSQTANFVDYDNDGRTDLHLIPGGTYRQVAGHRFAHTALARPGGHPVKATAGWFDFDADGSRDAVLAVRQRGPGRYSSLSLLENTGPVGHWLEVELTGPRGNRQAIGAEVSATTPGRTQTQWVGQNDGSHLSQGHYRLYFGLGSARSASLKVTWPDGSLRRLGSVRADRILRLTQGG